MLINILLFVIAVVVLLLFLWPRGIEENKQEATKDPRCACSTCECNGETVILKEKKK